MTPGIEPGSSSPLGATPSRDGVQFSLFSRHADGVELCFFDRADDVSPSRAIRLDAATHRTYYYWHVFVPGVRSGQLYGYRAAGPYEPERGMRFDATKLLVDPYARGVVVPPSYSRQAARPGDTAATAMKSVVVDPLAYIFKTIDLILGIPPLNHYDAAATDLRSIFTSRPDMRPYNYIRPVFVAKAAVKESWKELTRGIDFSQPDRDEVALRSAIQRSEGLPRPRPRH